MDPTAFAALLERCAPGAAHEPLTAIVRQVSSFEPFLITIDGRKPIHLQATSREEAIRLTMEATATGQSVRVGLAQLGPEDLKQVGLTISAAFDTCKHVAAVGRLLNVRLQAAGANGRDPDTATMSAIGSFTAMPAPAPSNTPTRKAPPLPSADEVAADGSTANDAPAKERATWDVYRSKRGNSVFVYER
jgi:type IV secretion system protein VirB1